MTHSQPPDWDGLLREFAKQQDAQILANRNLTNLTNGNMQGSHDQVNKSHRSRSIDFIGPYSDDSDDDDFEGFEEYSHRLGYLDSVTSQNLEEKMMSTTSTPASSRVSSRTMIPQPKLEQKPSSDSLTTPSTRKKTNLSRKKSESFDSLLMLPTRSSDSFVVPTVQPYQKLPLPDRQVKSTSSPGYSPKKIVQSNSGSIQLNKPQPITFKRPALLNSNQEVPGSKLHKNLKNSSSNDLDEDGSISLMVEQFIRVIKKHGEVLQKGNRISFVVKNKTNVTSEKMERISYTLRHAKKVLNLLRKRTGMDFELIDETNGSVQAVVRDSTGKYKVLPPIHTDPKQQQQQQQLQKTGKINSTEKEKAEIPLRTYEDYRKLPDPTLRGGKSTGPAISFEQQQMMAAKVQKMREYDEAIRLHNLDKFNSSNRRSSDRSDSYSSGTGTGAGLGDLSKLQEIELAHFLQQRDSQTRRPNQQMGSSGQQLLKHSLSHPSIPTNSKRNTTNVNQPITTQNKNNHQSEAFLQLVERDRQRKETRQRKLSSDSIQDESRTSSAVFASY